MTKRVKIKLIRPYHIQKTILNDPSRFKVVVIGRQAGKTSIAIYDSAKRVLRGETIWFCSPTNKNNKRVYPMLKQILKNIPGIYTNDSDQIIRLPNGGMIQFVSLKLPDNLRGPSLDHLIVDEAAFVYNEETWTKVLRPMLIAKQGSATFYTTPNGKNWIWRLFVKGQDVGETDWASWQFSSYESPFITDEELDDIRQNTAESVFNQEYMAEFVEGAGAVFRNIRECIYGDMTKRRVGECVMGVDWGKYQDYTVLTVIDVNTNKVIDIDRFNKISWPVQRARLKALAQRYSKGRNTNSVLQFLLLLITRYGHEGGDPSPETKTPNSRSGEMVRTATYFWRTCIYVLVHYTKIR